MITLAILMVMMTLAGLGFLLVEHSLNVMDRFIDHE